MPTLNWIGKDKVITHHQEVPFRVLEHKYNFGENNSTEVSDNKIIHGDNLEALKALLPEYEGRIKCIYIDPPYNTGNENWVYNDNVNDPKIKKWLGQVVGKEAEDLTRHDKWLCMMYPRLKLLHQLLAEDGAIFISIDYREQANLKLICNEIFGVNNYITEIACINNPKGRSDDKYFATTHESIVVFRKTSKFEIGGFEPEENITKRYNKVDSLNRKYREIDLRKTGDEDLREDRPDMFYPFFYNKATNNIMVGDNDKDTPNDCIRILPMKTKDIEGRWRWGCNTAKNQVDLLIVRYMPAKKQWGVFEMDYLDKREEITPTTHWNFKDVNSERGTEMFIKFLGFKKQDFPNPKPVGTIERIIKIATNPGDIVLDSFAGSGTTSQAVLNLNKQETLNRKFILIEMENYAENITAERVRRVINGYGDMDGTGGNFAYYELGQAIFTPNHELNETIGEDKIRRYIYYSETSQPLTRLRDNADDYLLDVFQNTAYYFYYLQDQLTTLDLKALKLVTSTSEQYVIYADNCLLDKDFMRTNKIIFKKIPRDIKRF